MSKQRVNLTLDEGVLDYAKQIMALRRFNNLVALLEQLLREEYERRNGTLTMKDAPLSSSPGHQAAGQVLDAHDAHARGAASTEHSSEKRVSYKVRRKSGKKPGV
jgi:hypothetical protein